MNGGYLFLISAFADILIIAAVFYYVRRYYGKKTVEMKSTIGRLEQELKEYRAIDAILGEKRRHFRLKLDAEPCIVRIVDFGESQLRRLNSKITDCRLQNISLDGMQISSTLDFPIDKNVIVNLVFTIDDLDFDLRGMVIWKKIRHDANKFYYGVKLMQLTATDETNIQQLMNQRLLAKRELKVMKSGIR